MARAKQARSPGARWWGLLDGSPKGVRDRIAWPGWLVVRIRAVVKSHISAMRQSAAPVAYLVSSALVAAALTAGLILQRFLQVTNVSPVFLVAVLVSAVAWGLGPSLLACFASVLAFNFFFLPPLYTLTIAESENVVALVVFAVVAVIASDLTARVRDQALVARQQQMTTAALYAFSRKLTGIGKLNDLLWATAHHVASMLKVRVVILLPDGGDIRVRAGYPPECQLSAIELAAARSVWASNRAAGHDPGMLPDIGWLFVPMHTDSGAVGVTGVQRGEPGPTLSPDERALLDALVDQAAMAIERVNLATGIEEARVEAETERLRAALLTSISHDLRTPLASILGAATSLRTYGRFYDEAIREDLVATVHEEAERLNRFVGNLLDMTRLESGSVEVKRNAVDLTEVVGTALRRAGSVLEPRRVDVDVAPDLPMLDVDYLLLEQVFVNLLDNAAKYAPEDTLVRIAARRDSSQAAIEIIDEGPGIPPGDVERIFDKFYRVRALDRQRAGTGLGLAICRGFVESMGGTIAARSRADRSGAVFTLRLPIKPTGAAPNHPELGHE